MKRALFYNLVIRSILYNISAKLDYIINFRGESDAELRKRRTYFCRSIFWEVCTAGSRRCAGRVHFPLANFSRWFYAEK